jgi:hypothetical protein
MPSPMRPHAAPCGPVRPRVQPQLCTGAPGLSALGPSSSSSSSSSTDLQKAESVHALGLGSWCLVHKAAEGRAPYRLPFASSGSTTGHRAWELAELEVDLIWL